MNHSILYYPSCSQLVLANNWPSPARTILPVTLACNYTEMALLLIRRQKSLTWWTKVFPTANQPSSKNVFLHASWFWECLNHSLLQLNTFKHGLYVVHCLCTCMWFCWLIKWGYHETSRKQKTTKWPDISLWIPIMPFLHSLNTFW